MRNIINIFKKIKIKIFKEIKFIYRKIFYQFKIFVPLKMINASYLNLGDVKNKSMPYYSASIKSDSDIYLNITKTPYKWMYENYKFIWSERMLEHIKFSDIPKTLENIEKMITKNGRCRMCLPICFYGTKKINMLRKGNYLNCFNQGHITWFTFEKLGPISKECFGSSQPPANLGISWFEILKKTSLEFEPIRYYRPDSTLWINKEIMNEENGFFYDEPEIKIKRKDSLIFDLIKKS